MFLSLPIVATEIVRDVSASLDMTRRRTIQDVDVDLAACLSYNGRAAFCACRTSPPLADLLFRKHKAREALAHRGLLQESAVSN
jgi:hypothetical protein